jgi:two-component system sensor histidine kinase AlgZ
MAVVKPVGRDGNQPPAARAPRSFLPDFCAIGTLFVVVLLAQLLAFVLTLVATTGAARRIEELALISLLTQWLALTAAAALCCARRWLQRLPDVAAGAGAFVLVLVALAAVSELAWWIIAAFGPHRAMVYADHGEFVFRNLAVGIVVAAVALRYCYVQFHWQRQLEAQASARLQALQARIRPHFLFNCLNTIASLTRVRPRDAERATEDLADLFRVSLTDNRELVPLVEELELCRKYLGIESLRLGTRLQVEWAVDALPRDARLPLLTLQPLIENAVYHGIEPRPEGGVVRIAGHSRDGTLEIEITNPLAQGGNAVRTGNRLAQDNVRQRLNAAFADSAALAIEPSSDRYRVRVRFPYRGAAGNPP